MFGIRFRDNGSGSGSGSGSDSGSDMNKFQIFSEFCKCIKTRNDAFLLFICLLFPYIKQNKWFKKKKNILIILVDFYVSLLRIFLLLGSGSTFPDVDPLRPNDTDPTGSETLQVGFVFGYFQLHFKSITMNLVNIWEKITECLYKT